MKIIVCACVFLFVLACAEPRPEGGADSETSREPDDSTQIVELDLREANVIDVSYDAETGQFGVTLQHDDDGEEGYADWWQVETLDGELLGRRVLTHRHDNNPFTRYTTISDLQGETYVVVRGHDMDHGYGGQVIILNVDTGEFEAIVQESEAEDFSNFSPNF